MKDLLRWRQLFEQLQVKEFVYGATIGRRFTDTPGGRPMTRRVLMTDSTTAAGFEWLFGWFDELRHPDHARRLLDAALVM
ncbi:hypothetical protein, partial [Salmonella sp. SAL4449]|uniref:hypothetical protein n=1 Tax=Salmonella sp. SAL4449 TaxID=3159904 RepID=UPI00397DCF4B